MPKKMKLPDGAPNELDIVFDGISRSKFGELLNENLIMNFPISWLSAVLVDKNIQRYLCDGFTFVRKEVPRLRLALAHIGMGVDFGEYDQGFSGDFNGKVITGGYAVERIYALEEKKQ